MKSLAVLTHSEGGWVAQVAADGRKMTGYRLWQALGRELGWGLLKSMRFTVRRDGNAFVFEGHGLGHGVGLCQWGAKGQAEKGISYARILASYYPGTAIARR
ncbi:Amidase enhancer precursor [compost metagenome]